MKIIGGFLLGIGVSLHLSAAFIMMKAFREKRLLTNGLFGICRHPMYSTLFFMILPGVSLLFNTWLIMLGIPVLLFLFFRNTHQEDEYLSEQFGEDFDSYRKEVGALLPRIITTTQQGA